MLTELCGYLKNWFEVDKLYGGFKIASGVITYADGEELPILEGQHFRIIGSIFNDGVYEYSDEIKELKDEDFTGSVWLLAIPKDLISLATDISEWMTKYAGADSAALSPFNSESFGGYSYSKSGGNTAAGNAGSSWQSVFGNRLMRYRKV